MQARAVATMADRLQDHRPIEMSDDARFAPRVLRLAAISAVALGVIFAQWAATQPSSAPILIALGAGWLLMPTVLLLSLRRPPLRYALVVPASAVGLSLLAICLQDLPIPPIAQVGWRLVSLGVWMGGLLGVWFWLRWLPVPGWLQDPYAPGRWALISLHAGVIVIGLSLLIVSDLV